MLPKSAIFSKSFQLSDPKAFGIKVRIIEAIAMIKKNGPVMRQCVRPHLFAFMRQKTPMTVKARGQIIETAKLDQNVDPMIASAGRTHTKKLLNLFSNKSFLLF